MTATKSLSTKQSVQTPSGRISYTEQGSGPVALFVHGVLLNGYLWRHQQAGLSGIRRTIAVDLLAHGDTEIASDQDVSVTVNANMLNEFLDALNIAIRWMSSEMTAAAASPKYSPLSIRNAFEASRSLTAIRMITGRPRHSSPLLRW